MNDHWQYKAGLDAASLLTLIGWWMEALPAIATMFTVIWSGLRVYSEWLVIQEKRKGLKEPPQE